MGLHIAAVILTEWLLIAGWFSERIIYDLGALLVVLVWWMGWRRDRPRWPSSRLLRIFIYLGFGGITSLVFIIAKTPISFIAGAVITILAYLDFRHPTPQQE